MMMDSSSTPGSIPLSPVSSAVARQAPYEDLQLKRRQCPICGKVFERKDSLSRHIRIHNKNGPTPKSRKKSCIPCFKSKIRCLAERPTCTSCLKRNIQCMYDSYESRKSLLDSYTCHDDRTEHLTSILPVSDSIIGSTSSLNNGEHPYPPDRVDTMDTNLGSSQLEGASTLGDFQDPLLSQKGLFENDLSSTFTPNAFFPDSNLDLNLEWIFGNSTEEIFPSMPTSIQDISSFIQTADRLHPQVNKSLDGPARDGYNDQESVEEEGNFTGLPTPTPQDRCGPDDVWPMEWHAVPERRFVLPPLGSSDEHDFVIGRAHFPTKTVNSATRVALQDSVRYPLERNPWHAVSLAAFPSKEKLDHCIDLYFVHFNPMLPIIHRPTFDPAEDLWVTLTVACIGACYTEFEDARTFSTSLSELNRRLLLFMAERDPRFIRTEWYVTAQLLQGIHGFSSGSKRLFELSDSNRSFLVNNAKCMGLFHPQSSMPPAEETLEARWRAWIKKERLNRLAWAIYEYDSSVSYLHNTRPCLSTADVTMDMPSSAEHWEAETMHSWAALHPWTEQFPRRIQFRPVIRTLFDGTERAVEKIRDDRHRHLIILTLSRVLWSMKEIRGSPISDLVRDSQDESQKNLLEVLDRFLQYPTVPPAGHTRWSLANIIRHIQMIHTSHFYAAGDLMDWLYPLLRGGPDGENAKSRMLRWEAQDAMRVREIAYRSAQTLALIREHPENQPLEAFNAFHAGAVLWCMAGLLSRNIHRHRSTGLEREPTVCRLDYLALQPDNKSMAVRIWVREGGPQLISVYGVPDLCCSQGQKLALEQTAEILSRMKVWGIAQNFSKVILGLIQQGDGQST